MFRLLAAFVLTPLVLILAWVMLQPSGDLGNYAMPWGVAAIHITVILLGVTPIAISLFAVCWAIKRIQWYWAVLAGGCLGLLCYGPFAADTVFNDRLRDWKKIEALQDLGVVVVGSMALALLIWILGIWRNPELWTRVSRPESK